MRHYKTTMILLSVLICCNIIPCAYGNQSGNPKTGIRLAIIDIGPTKPIPSELIDLLSIELSKDSEITLLEREQIALILEEQALGLSFTGSLNSSDIIKSGKILAADAILILKNETNPKDKIDMRLRLLDARNGLKLLDSEQIIHSKSADHESTIQVIAKSVLQHVKRININIDKLLLIGVSTFKSEEMAKSWDWLSDVIPIKIEQNLILYPEISLMERNDVSSLLEERELTTGLPEALVASAILVDGSYRIDRTENVILLFVRARRNQKNIFEINMKGSLDEIEFLCEKAAKMILEDVRSGPVEKSMDPVLEAKMLGGEAETHLARREYAHALAAAESAHALMPQVPEYLEFIVRALDPQSFILNSQETKNARFRILNLTERIVRHYPLPNFDGPDYEQAKFYWGKHMFAMEKGFRAMNYGYNVKDDLYAEFSRHALRFFEVCYERYAGKEDRLYKRILYKGSSLIGRFENIDEAIQMTDRILKEEVKLNDQLHAFNGFFYAVKGNWADDAQALKKSEDFLAVLCDSSIPRIRIDALTYSIRFYSEISLNHEKLQKLGKEYVEFCKVYTPPPSYPSYISGNCNPDSITNKPFFPSKKDSEFFELGLLKDMFDFAFENNKINTTIFYWSKSTLRLADLLEKQGRPDEAIDYLKKMRERFYGASQKDWQWQALQEKIIQIQERYPSIKTADTYQGFNSTLVYSAKNKIFQNQGIKNIRFRRLIVDAEEIVIIYSHGNRYGIIRLKRKNMQVLAIQPPQAVESFVTNWANDRWEYARGPAVTIHKGDVYLGFMHAGFLIFSHDGKIMRFNEKNGLAYNNIRNLVYLNDRIYAQVGRSWRDSGLMELNLKTKHSKIIASTRVEKARHEVDKRAIRGITPDPKRNVLWVFASNQYQETPKWNELYSYNPKNGVFQRMSTPKLDEFFQKTTGIEEIDGLSLFGDSLLIFNASGLCEFNLTNQQTTILFSRYHYAKWSFPWAIRQNIIFAPWKGGLICQSFGKILYFQDGEKEPNYISNTLLGELDSNKLEIRELVPTEEGLYVLTPDNLFLISENKSNLNTSN